MTIIPFPATAAAAPSRAKGAAEYDLEYYLRDIFPGNKPEGNLPQSSATAPPPRLPRTLRRGTFLVDNLLNDDLPSCIPLRELSEITTIPMSSLSQDIQTLRSKVRSAFRSSRPWKVESVSDEYYFDVTCYAVWKVAAVAMPKDYEKRNAFVRNIGRRGLDAIILQSENDNGLGGKSLDALLLGRRRSSSSLTSTIPVIIDLLNLFQSSGYCSGYRIGDDNDTSDDKYNSNNNNNKYDKGSPPSAIFDSLDDEELSTRGGSVNCLVSIYDPATLGSALQITGEGSRFVPDFVGTILAAAWERMLNDGSGDDDDDDDVPRSGGTGGGDDDGDGAVVVTYESYFVDPVYRPNPKDFFPNERLYQFTIARK